MTTPGFPLIYNLSIQRQGVCELLERINPGALGSEAGFELLASLQVRLLFHLRVEDDLLVAILDGGAEQYPEIATVMSQWVYPLRSCAELAQAFFQHWLGLDRPAGDLQGDWAAMKGLLLLRMETSERLLYPAYKRLHGERRRKPRSAANR